MRSAIICPLLLIAACWLACFRGTRAECCTTTVTLTYRVAGENCGAVGGTRGQSDCTVTICGNGEPLVGTYCGKGPCNVFGCECENGCLHGDWSQDYSDISLKKGGYPPKKGKSKR